VHGLDPATRRRAYACDVTYCTNKELTFDYLRDRVAPDRRNGDVARKLGGIGRPASGAEAPLLRGLHFALVDEADSVLVDEARTPLILSREANSEAEARLLEQALELARALKPQGVHYRIYEDLRQIELTAEGLREVEAFARPLGGPWLSRIQREETVSQALTALFLMRRDEHYIVRDGKVQIVDEYTGRVMADRFWSEGLHQLIELKEGCDLSGKRLTLARMTYQRFFRRYKRLAGMTGTGAEIAGELWRVYRLRVARVPTHRPSRRVMAPDRVFVRNDDKWRAITAETAALVARGLPVLIGTRSVAASLEASAHLTAAGIAHMVLNAAQDSAEAEIVAQAGGAGRVTVATNMAGRGTDIKLTREVSARGGLHVIMSERHDSVRIDRQLAGRCARQGEPGRFCAVLSLEDPLFACFPLPLSRSLATIGMRLAGEAVGRYAMRTAQRHAERINARIRGQLLKHDETIDHALAFTGKPE
jgi:preprotein translocase subunit SecA